MVPVWPETRVTAVQPYNTGAWPVFAARCYASAAYTVSVYRCVGLSITFVNSVEINKHIFKFFSPSGSQTILVFPDQTAWQYSDGDPWRGRRMQGAGRNRNFEPIFGSIACCVHAIHSAATDRGELITLVAGKRRSLLMRETTTKCMTRSINTKHRAASLQQQIYLF